MRILVTGGRGSVGRELVPALLAAGHGVAVLDPAPAAPADPHRRLTVVQGSVGDDAALAEAIRGADAVVHLAWSFSDDPATLLEVDLRGEVRLLEAARAQGVRRIVLASSAIVYGSPERLPVDEDHPRRPLAGRKPAYGAAKVLAEDLALLAARDGGPAATVLRFWWAFGATIPGKHLRELLRQAAAGATLRVPLERGGSFVTMEDLAAAVELALLAPRAGTAEVFNVASAWVSWEEVARAALAATRSAGAVELVAPADWSGPTFLSDAWLLDDRRIRAELGFRPRRDPEGVRAALRAAIEATWKGGRA